MNFVSWKTLNIWSCPWISILMHTLIRCCLFVSFFLPKINLVFLGQNPHIVLRVLGICCVFSKHNSLEWLFYVLLQAFHKSKGCTVCMQSACSPCCNHHQLAKLTHLLYTGGPGQGQPHQDTEHGNPKYNLYINSYNTAK